MCADQSSKRKTHVPTERPPFERVALILQGGGALGAYQAGVYQALAEANLHPDWVAGISIGAINSALIAGNPPEKRVRADCARSGKPSARRRSGSPISPAQDPTTSTCTPPGQSDALMGILLGGAPGFFTPRVPPPFLHPPGSLQAISFYDVAPLKATLERLVDFDRSMPATMRFSVGAVNVHTGNFVYFDSTTHQIGPAHVMASGSLPPGFPATEIDGEYYWDGGLVSNTPLQWVLDSHATSGHAGLSDRSVERARRVAARSDRVRDAPEGNPLFEPHPGGDRPVQEESSCSAARPPSSRQTPERRYGRRQRRRCSRAEADEKVYNIIQMIYHAKNLRGHLEGLRVLAPDDGGALEIRLQRHRSHAAPSGGAAAPEEAMASSPSISPCRAANEADVAPFSARLSPTSSPIRRQTP